MVLIEISSVLRYLEISFACNNKLRQNRVKKFDIGNDDCDDR